MRNFAIIGTGAVGGFYGARLQHSGREVHFLLHSDYDHVRRHGLKITSPEGDFHLRKVNAYKSADAMPPCDVVCLTLKTTANHLLPEILPPVTAPNGVVLVMQNGLGIEKDVAAVVGPERVMSALCFLCAMKTGPGEIHHLDYGAIRLADYSPYGTPMGVTQRMREISEDFRQAGIRVELVDDFLLARWQKLVWNIPFNALCTILNVATDKLMADEEATALVESIMQEVVALAEADGRIISEDFVREMIYDTRKMIPYSPSMKVDHEKRRPMEIDAIYGRPLQVAEQKNVSVPAIEMLYRLIAFIGRMDAVEADSRKQQIITDDP